jgi:general secretion pathway protein I
MICKPHASPGFTRTRGLSLIEVLVAFVILAMVVSVIMRINATSMRNHNVSAQYLQAVQLARTQMTEMGLDRQSSYLTQAGDGEEGVSWEYEREPYGEWQEARLQSLRQIPVEERITLYWTEQSEASPRQISFTKVSLIEPSR